MDPQATWNRMLDAWKHQCWEELQEAATDLGDWTSRGGFPPEVQTEDRMGMLWNRAVARAVCELAINICWQVFQSPDGIPHGLPFSLSCVDCDVDSPPNYEAARTAGWTGIEFRPDMQAAIFRGYCPKHIPEPPWVT
ncbi:MAG: hypothetical protein ABGZ17_11515 [Planctomycetaceae bacterium]